MSEFDILCNFLYNMDTMQGIYRILNTKNGKYYIGSSQNIGQRLKRHLKALRDGNHINPYLQSAWNKYGADSFICEVIEEVTGASKALLAREQVYLDMGFIEKVLYNIGEIADCPPRLVAEAHGMFGRHHTDEARQKMSASHMGKVLTEEHRANIGKANTGREVTKETCDKINEAQMGNTNGADKYAALYNNQTGEVIPPGMNFKALCQERGFNYNTFRSIMTGENICTRDGWQLLENKGKLKELKQRPWSYPAFYNEQTKQVIVGGRNLKELCEERALNYNIMGNLRKGITRCSMDGWRLATESEIASRSMSP